MGRADSLHRLERPRPGEPRRRRQPCVREPAARPAAIAAPRRRSPGRRPRRAYQQASSVLRDAFAQPDVLSLMFPSPIGTVPGVALLHLRITEMLVHGWDLAQATAQPARLPDDLPEQELRFTRAKLGDIPAGRTPFAPPHARLRRRARDRPPRRLPPPPRHSWRYDARLPPPGSA